MLAKLKDITLVIIITSVQNFIKQISHSLLTRSSIEEQRGRIYFFSITSTVQQHPGIHIP